MEITLPPLHKCQRQVALDPARFRVLSAGRRFGKSRLGVTLCVAAALQRKRAWWVGPDYPTTQIGWRLLTWLAQQIPGTAQRSSDRRIEMPGGGWVQVRSANAPASLRGEGLDLLVIDEAAHIPKFAEVWEQALRPALSDRQGGALFISTPKGHNSFYELFRQAEASEDWAAYQFPTSANPHIAATEIEAARANLPALVFRQEYEAEFVQLAGALFRREYFHFVEAAPTCRLWVRYWDLAASTKTSADYMAGGKIGITEDGTIVIAHVVRGRWEWPDALRIIIQTAQADGARVAQGVEDVGVQKGMYQFIMREPLAVGLTFRPIPVRKDKIERVNPWLARAEQGKVVLVRGEWNAAFLDEVMAFPEGQHDDQVDAVSGAVQMLSGGGWVRGMVQ